MTGFYHQDERDYAVGHGCLVLIATLFLFAVIAIAAVVLASF